MIRSGFLFWVSSKCLTEQRLRYFLLSSRPTLRFCCRMRFGLATSKHLSVCSPPCRFIPSISFTLLVFQACFKITVRAVGVGAVQRYSGGLSLPPFGWFWPGLPQKSRSACSCALSDALVRPIARKGVVSPAPFSMSFQLLLPHQLFQ